MEDSNYAFTFSGREMLILADSIREYQQNDCLNDGQRKELRVLRERIIDAMVAIGMKPYPTTQWRY